MERDSNPRGFEPNGFGDLYSTVELCPYFFEMVEGDGFEPPNPKERIYSPPRLATSLPLHLRKTDGAGERT